MNLATLHSTGAELKSQFRGLLSLFALGCCFSLTAVATPSSLRSSHGKPAQEETPDEPLRDEDPEKKPHPDLTPDARRILKDVEVYLNAVNRSVRLEKSTEDLKVQLSIFPDALTYQVLEDFAEALRRGISPTEFASNYRLDPKEVRQLKGNSGFCLQLKQPESKGQRRWVHLFLGSLTRAFTFKDRKRPVAWTLWTARKRPRESEESRPTQNASPGGLFGWQRGIVKVARHYTVKRRRLVPFVSPLKPKGPRFFMSEGKAELWGVFNGSLKERKRRVTLAVRIGNYDAFWGEFDSDLVLNLEDDQHRFSRGQEVSLQEELPADYPELSEELTKLVKRFAKIK